MLRVYIAAPFMDAPQVRDLDTKLGELGVDVTSAWARTADALPAFETRRARETLWVVVEGMGGEREAGPVRGLRLVGSGRGA